MTTLTEDHKSTLRRLIGSPVNYRGKNCVVLELLEKDASLVLEEIGLRGALQSDQYGDAGRHVSEIFTLPLLAEDGSGNFHPEFCKLGLSLCE
jgi:hypothetical protein